MPERFNLFLRNRSIAEQQGDHPVSNDDGKDDTLGRPVPPEIRHEDRIEALGLWFGADPALLVTSGRENVRKVERHTDACDLVARGSIAERVTPLGEVTVHGEQRGIVEELTRKLEEHIEDLKAAIAPAGGLWVGWPKRSSGVETDMTEDVVREVALPLGLVDVKVCAIDETWSGLRLVIRVTER